MPPRAVVRHAEPSCPRCGYNLSGTASSWREQCPLRGRCNECGLEFEWSRAFLIGEHPWLFEYSWRRAPIRRFLTTCWHALNPWRFWRSVNMAITAHQPTRRLRRPAGWSRPAGESVARRPRSA